MVGQAGKEEEQIEKLGKKWFLLLKLDVQLGPDSGCNVRHS